MTRLDSAVATPIVGKRNITAPRHVQTARTTAKLNRGVRAILPARTAPIRKYAACTFPISCRNRNPTACGLSNSAAMFLAPA